MLYAIIGLLVIIADQYIKFWVQGHIALTSTGEEFIPGILSLANVHNDGAAFGFLAGSGARIPFIIVAGVFTVAVIIALATKLISGKLARWSIVLVTAGALSNCLDRVLYGYVQDMFKTEFMNFPVFNLADVFITVFAIIFALAVIFGKTRRDDEDDYEFEDDEDDEEYEKPARASRKKQKRKLALFLAPVVLALLFAGASVWGYLSAEKQRTADYDFILAEAANESDPTTALNRYYEAITTDPTRTDAYLGNDDFSGMIDYLTRDGELTVSESSWLSRLKAGLDQKGSSGYSSTVDVLAELRAADPSGYEQVCYEIGEAYLFYYSVPVEKDRYAAAATWFQYAKEGYPIADMYCQISACLQNIAKYEKSEQHAKLYEEYQSLWSQILKLKTDANDFDDDLKLRIWNEITNMIQNNAKAFCEVTPPEEILVAID